MSAAARPLSEAQLRVVRFCAVECRLQGSGEVSVYRMLEAWTLAQRRSRDGRRPTEADVLALGQAVEPVLNAGGYRTVGVRVGLHVMPPPEQVPGLMVELLAHVGSDGSAAWFAAFERVHPFRDGNGRVGATIFNWLSGTLGDPVWPPDPFGDPRRRPDAGLPADAEPPLPTEPCCPHGRTHWSHCLHCLGLSDAAGPR